MLFFGTAELVVRLPARMSHDYLRHGTVNLFAALEVASNLVGRWFSLITSQAIRRGGFDAFGQLEQAIVRCIDRWNENPRSRWSRSVADIKHSLEVLLPFMGLNTSTQDGDLAFNPLRPGPRSTRKHA